MIEEDYNFANVGTIYLLDAIETICMSDDYIALLVNLEKNVYKQIAKRYNVNEKTLKSDIYKATNKMNEIKDFKNASKKEKINETKLTPKIVINNIVDKIKNGDKGSVIDKVGRL